MVGGTKIPHAKKKKKKDKQRNIHIQKQKTYTPYNLKSKEVMYENAGSARFCFNKAKGVETFNKGSNM